MISSLTLKKIIMESSKDKFKNLFFLFISISIVSTLSYWRALDFHFWRDDWYRFWAAAFNPELLKMWFGLPDHPGLAVEHFFSIKIFGLNPFWWQIWGLSLKIINSLEVSLLIFGLTKLKKSAFLAGLLFASTPVGLESYTWASNHTAALNLLFFLPGFYLFIEAFQKYNLLKYISSLFFITIAFLISPARGAALPFLIILWTLIFFKDEQDMKKKFLLVGTFLIFIFGVFLAFQGIEVKGLMMRSNTFLEILAKPSLVLNFFISIGNLAIGWFIPIPELNSSPNPVYNLTFLSILSGLILIGLITIFLFKLFKKHSKKYALLSFFGLMIPLSFFPNWWYYSYALAGVSHRYLTLSGVGLVGILAVLLSDLKPKQGFLFLIIVIFFNILTSNLVLIKMYKYRSFSKVEEVWNQIDKYVPKEKKEIIFVFTGNDPRKLSVLDWSGSIPFAIKRNIKDFKEFPIVVSSVDQTFKFLCGGGTYGYFGSSIVYKDPIPLSSLYVWEYEGGKLTNRSEGVRSSLKGNVNCQN